MDEENYEISDRTLAIMSVGAEVIQEGFKGLDVPLDDERRDQIKGLFDKLIDEDRPLTDSERDIAAVAFFVAELFNAAMEEMEETFGEKDLRSSYIEHISKVVSAQFSPPAEETE